MTALHDWLRSRRRRAVAALLAAVGCVLLVVGSLGVVDRRALAALIVQHVLSAGEQLRNGIGAAAEGGLGRRCGDGRRVVAVVPDPP